MIFNSFQSAFSRFFVVFFVFSGSFSLLYSQQNADILPDSSQPMFGDPQNNAGLQNNPGSAEVKGPAAKGTSADDAQSLLKSPAEKVMGVEDIRPVAAEMELVDPDYDRRGFEQIKKVIIRVKGELESFKQAVLEKKEHLDGENSLKGLNFYRFFSSVFTNYYKYVMPSVRNQFYLVRAQKALGDAGRMFEERKAVFPLIVSPEELREVVFELKFLSALVNAFRGTKKDLLRAVTELEFLLGEKGESQKVPYISDDVAGMNQRLKMYSYLVGILDRLYYLTRDDAVLSNKILRGKLYYLWRLTAIKNADNEELKNIKLQSLYDKYSPIMDLNGRNYELYYRPFGKSSLSNMKDLETKLLEESGKNSTKMNDQRNSQNNRILDNEEKSPAISDPVAPEDLFRSADEKPAVEKSPEPSPAN